MLQLFGKSFHNVPSCFDLHCIWIVVNKKMQEGNIPVNVYIVDVDCNCMKTSWVQGLALSVIQELSVLTSVRRKKTASM